MNFSPAQLAAFLALADTHSFTRAADRLGVSQPTLSRTIVQLETAVGVRLFDRDTRHIALTTVGAAFRPIAQRLANDMGAARQELAQLVQGQRGRLVVAALPSVAGVLLPRTIAAFRATHPDLDIVVNDTLSEPVLASVAEGRADIGITTRPSPAHRLFYRPLLSDRFCLVAPAGSACGRTKLPAWAVFQHHPFIAMSPASSVRAMTDAAFLQAGIAVAPLFECAHLSTTGGLVVAGLGITALPQLAIAMLPQADMAVRPLIRPVLNRGIGIITRRRQPGAPAIEAFSRALLETAKSISKTWSSAPP